MVYDPVHKVVVLHGGFDKQTNWANDTWAWDGAHWTQLSPLVSPPADGWVRDQPLCWDSQHGVVVLLNEQGNAAGSANPTQTWQWDGSAWTRISDTGAPSIGITSNQPVAMTFDTARKTVLVFAQMSGVPTTWTFDGTKWAQVATSGTMSANFAIAADDANSSVVIVGSNGDTWTWDGSKWTVQHPAHSPSGSGVMAYDAVRHIVVLLGAGTWTWNGSDWTQLV
jgi:hypothetical protein